MFFFHFGLSEKLVPKGLKVYVSYTILLGSLHKCFSNCGLGPTHQLGDLYNEDYWILS